MTIDRRLVNVLVLSLGFMLVFTAFQTMSNIEKTVLKSISEDDENFHGDGYTSLAIIYAVFALSNWLAPSYISLTGPRVAILTGSCCYVAFIGSFLWPSTILLYTFSVVLGLGAALIWTGHGQYLTENSDNETMSRNAGIFWAILQTSLFTGNLFVYFMFQNKSKIDPPTRRTIFLVLGVLAVIGTIILTSLRKVPKVLSLGEAEGVSSADKELEIPEPKREKSLLTAWRAFKDAFILFSTPKMIYLSLTFIYTGLSLTFFATVYSSSIGFTTAMGDNSTKYVGLSGIFIGFGEVVGGVLFGILSSKISTSCGGWPIVLTGFFTHIFAFVGTFLNLPNNAPFENTNSTGYIDPSPTLAMAGSLALGFGDACYNTQVYALLGILYSKESAPAFALFKFCQSVAAAVSFSYSNVIGLHFQLLILLVAIVLGTSAFIIVERKGTSSSDEDNPVNDPTFIETPNLEE